jgi:integrase
MASIIESFDVAPRKKAITALMVERWANMPENARCSVGNSVFFCKTGKSMRWGFRYRSPGTAGVRELGLGTYPAVGLSEARGRANEARVLLRQGKDPIEAKRALRAQATEAARSQAARAALAVTFETVARDYIAAHDPAWSRRHSKQWASMLSRFAFPAIGRLPPAEIDTGMALAMLQPIWLRVPESASRVRAMAEAIWRAAKVRKLCAGENPFNWKDVLSALLPARSRVRKVRHHPALPWQRMPEFMAYAKQQDRSITWRAIRFAVLTAARSGEVRNARWRDIDLGAALWTVPAELMKAGKMHRVPLSPQAIAVLQEMLNDAEPNPDTVVFPAPHGGQLSDMSLTMPLRRSAWRTDKGETLTLHGTARSSFRDWGAECSCHPSEVCEMALAHAVGDKVEAAYRRGDLFAKRIALMNDWGAFCADPTGGNIIPLRAAR